MHRILIPVLLLFLLSCSKDKEEPWTLKGKLEPKTVDFIVLKQLNDIERKLTAVIDTLYVTDEGMFKTTIPLEPYVYELVISRNQRIPIAVDKNQRPELSITGEEVRVSGSKDTRLLLDYEAFRKRSLDSLVKSVRRTIRELRKTGNPDPEKISALRRLEVDNYQKHIDELNRFIKQNMGTSIGIYATSIRWSGKDNLKFYDSLVTAFEAVHPGLKIAQKLREKVRRLQQTTIGWLAKDIRMPTPDGNPAELYKIHKKYILIDFWASWCGPCRTESKGLLKLYKKYKTRGFEIYGVSLDSNREKWLNALKKDQRIWTNVSTLQAFKTPAAFDYAVTALPANFLIDADHRIIAKNLHPDELEAVLKDLFAADDQYRGGN